MATTSFDAPCAIRRTSRSRRTARHAQQNRCTYARLSHRLPATVCSPLGATFCDAYRLTGRSVCMTVRRTRSMVKSLRGTMGEFRYSPTLGGARPPTDRFVATACRPIGYSVPAMGVRETEAGSLLRRRGYVRVGLLLGRNGASHPCTSWPRTRAAADRAPACWFGAAGPRTEGLLTTNA